MSPKILKKVRFIFKHMLSLPSRLH